MIEISPFERKKWQSRPEDVFHPNNEEKSWTNIASKSSEVEVSKLLFNLIPCNSRLRYCVDVGTRSGENFVGNTLITHSLLVSNDTTNELDHRQQGHEIFVDNDHKHGQNTWFGVLLQPDDRAFKSLQRLHQPLGNLCLQISPSVEEEWSKKNESLECILRQHVSELPLDFDYLGLNEMGYSNYWLLRNLLGSSSYRPKVVCISYDNTRPHDVPHIPDRNNEQELPSIRALVELMSCYDYQLAVTTSRCCFFSTKELYEGFLKSKIRYPIEELPTISYYSNADDNYVGQGPEHKFSKPYDKTNSCKTGLEIYSSNGTLHDNKVAGSSFLNKHQSFETTKTGMVQLQQLSRDTENRSDTLGMKWLLQRRKIFESSDSKATTNSLSHETPFEWQAPTRSVSIEPKLGMETHMNGITKTVDLKRLGNDNMMAWTNPEIKADDRFESRDDFISSPTIASDAREVIENSDFGGRRETDSMNIVDTIRFTNELTSQQSPSKMKKMDPVGDTILQKMKQNHISNVEKSLEGRIIESKNEIGIRKVEIEKSEPILAFSQNDSIPKATTNGSLIELKNETIKISEDNKKKQDSGISEEFLYTTNENDDDMLPKCGPIDLTALCGSAERSSEEEKSECSKRLITELQRNGYAMICGTSISRFLCRDALYASHFILYEAEESVRSSCKSENGILRGYTPKCTEQSGSSDLKDMVRKFRLGSEKGNTPNMWPAVGMLDEETYEYVQVSLQKYQDTIHQVAVSITKSMHEIISSDVADSHSPEHIYSPNIVHDPNSSLLTVFNCERGSRHDTRKPLMASHTDTSLVTILLVDGGDCANIQHELTEGKWENVRLPKVIPNDPIFVVYAGESLQKLSGSYIPSNSRRIVPCLGDQIVNGLVFSLMPSDSGIDPFLNEEPANSGYEELPNPISRLASELKGIDEVFQSYVFSNNADLKHDSNLKKHVDGDFEFTVDSFVQDLENARKIRRNHMESLRLGERNSSASDRFKKSPLLGKDGQPQDERDESSSKYSNQPSKAGTFGGPEVRSDEELTINSYREKARSSSSDCPKQLLGSHQLPIIIETKNATNPPTHVVKIDKNFKPLELFATDKKVRQNCESVDTKNLLPLASSWNPPSRDLSKLRKSVHKIDSFTMMKARKPNEDNGKKERSIRARNLYDIVRSRQRKALDHPSRETDIGFQPINENQGLAKDDDESSQNSDFKEKKRNTPSRNRRKDNQHPKNAHTIEKNSVQPSDISTILDEILGEKSDHQSNIDQQMGGARSNLKNSNLGDSSSQNCDPIYKRCREFLSSEQKKRVQIPVAATNQYETATKTNNSHSQPTTTKQRVKSEKKETREKSLLTSGNYVPFRGSVVEWKMRENAKKIRNSSLIWEKRGYTFGCENGKVK